MTPTKLIILAMKDHTAIHLNAAERWKPTDHGIYPSLALGSLDKLGRPQCYDRTINPSEWLVGCVGRRFRWSSMWAVWNAEPDFLGAVKTRAKVLTSFILASLSVPCSKPTKMGRINDCWHVEMGWSKSLSVWTSFFVTVSVMFFGTAIKSITIFKTSTYGSLRWEKSWKAVGRLGTESVRNMNSLRMIEERDTF